MSTSVKEIKINVTEEYNSEDDTSDYEDDLSEYYNSEDDTLDYEGDISKYYNSNSENEKTIPDLMIKLEDEFNKKAKEDKYEYLNANQINHELNCLCCKKRLIQPKILPCANTICMKCEVKCFKNNLDKMCPLCNCKHELLEDQCFPLNKMIENLLKTSSYKICRSEKYEKARNIIEGIDNNCKKYKKILEDVDLFIENECESLILSIDAATESIIEEINKQRNILINKVKEFKNVDISNKGILAFQKYILKTKIMMNQYYSKINDNENINNDKLLKIYSKAKSIEFKFKQNENKFYDLVFNRKKINFHKNYNIQPNLIGILSPVAITNINFDRIIKNESSVRFCFENLSCINNGKLIEFNDGSYMYFLSDNKTLFSGMYSKFGKKIDILPSENCSIIHDIIKHNNYVVISYRIEEIKHRPLASRYHNYVTENFDILKIYDVKMRTRHIVLNFVPKIMFSDDCYIYICDDNNKLYVYNERLRNIVELDFEKYKLSKGKISYINGKLFDFNQSEVKIFDFDNKEKNLKTIKLDSKYDKSNFLTDVISEDTIAIVDKLNRVFELYDLNLNLILNFEIKDIECISWFGFTGSGKMIVMDYKNKTVNIL